MGFALISTNSSAQLFEDAVKQPKNQQLETTASGKKIIRNPIISQAEKSKVTSGVKPKILMYYKNFKVNTTPSGRIMCDFDLIIHNSTPNKITTLNTQLVWPSIKTSASFYEVPAYSERYTSMTLIGQGCYSMDKTPNIVVNHCRVKGMSGEECSAAILWVKVK